jgi:hypothetical protein
MSGGEDFQIYITEQPLLYDNVTFMVVKHVGVCLCYPNTDLTEGLMHMVLIRSRRLIEMFSDYIELYVPVSKALTETEKREFINSLIDELK